MHSLTELKRINSPRESDKLARANRLFNNPRLHAKSSEKGLVKFYGSRGEWGWTTDEQWERKMKREGKR